MLQRLRVKNFRLLRDVEIDFESGAPTVFIGPNGSGKSTVLEVLDFLSRCGLEGLQAAALAHGGIRSLRTIGVEEPIVIETWWGFVFFGAGRQGESSQILQWSITLQPEATGAVTVLKEELTSTEADSSRPLVTTNDRGVRSVRAQNEPRAKASRVQSADKLAFEEIADPSRFAALTHLRTLLGLTKVIGSLATAPLWARPDRTAPSPRDTLVLGPKKTLDRQGLGLANVLFGLFNNHHQTWEELERAFRAEFPFARRIVFPPDAGGSKISFAFEDERFHGRQILASEMSDGMIAYLCLLCAVLSPEQVGVLGLDEPDANLHPSALRRMMSLAHREHEKRDLAIVTHSNALLDELRDPARSIRVVESTRDGVKIRKLDPEALASWRKEYTLSEMRRTGLLDPANSTYGTDE